MNQKKKINHATRSQNEIMMNRLMLMFVVAVAAVTLVMSLRNANNEITMIKTVAPILTWLLGALFAASVVFFDISKKKNTDDTERSFTKYNVLGIGCVALLCAVAYAVNAALATGYAVAMIIGACLLYFIYYIYDTHFFALSVFCILEGFMLYTGYNNYAVGGIGYLIQVLSRIGVIALPVAFTVLSVIYVVLAKKAKPKFLVPIVICSVIGLIGGILLTMSSFFYIPSIYVLLLLAAAYVAAGIVKTLRMI